MIVIMMLTMKFDCRKEKLIADDDHKYRVLVITGSDYW